MYLIAVFIGTVFITLSPFVRKYLAEEITEWNHRYTVLMLVSYVVAVMVSVMLYALNPLSVSDPILVLAAGLTVGLASKPLVEEVIKHMVPGWFDNG
ncbi:MAG: hypothetical protein KAV87_00690, partial [Desulfobacteraceae bacterium]|nr:hypothetical protein [Desulfobacteraceae bacterium]